MSTPETIPKQPTRIHVAGPVETEARRGRRIAVQRCLRCDAVLWTTRAMNSGYALGDAVVFVEREGSVVATLFARTQPVGDELPCEPLPFAPR